MPTEETTK